MGNIKRLNKRNVDLFFSSSRKRTTISVPPGWQLVPSAPLLVALLHFIAAGGCFMALSKNVRSKYVLRGKHAKCGCSRLMIRPRLKFL